MSARSWPARLLRAAAAAALALLLAVASYLAFMSASDFRPPAEMDLAIARGAAHGVSSGGSLVVVTFNIGYGGMDAAADFFMDGGRGSRSRSRRQTETNLARISDFLARLDADLVLLQEVDLRATRSQFIDQHAALATVLGGRDNVMALNYKVPWVPVPLRRPLGAVRSGLLTFSRFSLASAKRLQLPGQEAWPRRLAELDRCLAQCRLPLAGGGELVVFNLHLSVFDKGGWIRRQQLDHLRGRLEAEQRRGSHVLAGGDWNHGLPGSDAKRFSWTAGAPRWYRKLPETFTPAGFSWAVDPGLPTIRASSTAYKPGASFVAVIDGFLVSDNIEILDVRAVDLGFENSDHNPVVARLRLR